MFPWIQPKYDSLSSGNGLVLGWRQDIIWTNNNLVCWRLYASLGLGDLIEPLTINVSEILINIHWNDFHSIKEEESHNDR